MDRGQYLIIPHLFDGTIYAYWKVRMRAFLQSLDEKVWQAVEIGWTKPKETPADWNVAKIKAANQLKLYVMEEDMWHQRSHSCQGKFRDKNTRFFREKAECSNSV